MLVFFYLIGLAVVLNVAEYLSTVISGCMSVLSMMPKPSLSAADPSIHQPQEIDVPDIPDVPQEFNVAGLDKPEIALPEATDHVLPKPNVPHPVIAGNNSVSDFVHVDAADSEVYERKTFCCLWWSVEKPDCRSINTRADTDIKSQVIPFIPYAMIILYMLQDFSLFHMNLYDCSNHWKLFSDSSTSDTTSTNPLLLPINEFGKWYGNLCLKSLFGINVTAVPKIYFKILFYIGVLLSFLFWYITLCFGRDTKFSNEKRVSIIAGFIAFQLFIYQDLSEDVISLLDCVSIQSTCYLRIDATYMCHETFLHASAIIYLIIFVVPFPIFIMFCPSQIRKGKINVLMFVAGMVVPGMGLLLFIYGHMQYKRNQSDTGQEREMQTYQSDTNQGTTPSANTDIRNTKEICTKIADTLQTNFRSVIIGIGNPKNDYVCDDMRKNSCNLTCLGVILGFRLIMVLCSVLFHAVDTNAFILFVLSFLRLFLIKPYTTSRLNRVYSISLFVILVVAGCTLGMSLLEKCQYENCAKDPLINSLGITIDVCTLYIPVLFGILLGIVIVVSVGYFIVKNIKRCLWFTTWGC